MSALFELTPHGWVCRKVWQSSMFKRPVVASMAKSLFINISKAPKHGFCRRPHFYI